MALVNKVKMRLLSPISKIKRFFSTSKVCKIAI